MEYTQYTQAYLDRLVKAHWDTVRLVDEARDKLAEILQRVDYYDELDELTTDATVGWAANIVYDAVNSIAMDLVDPDEFDRYSAYDAQGAQDAFALMKNIDEIEETFEKARCQ